MSNAVRPNNNPLSKPLDRNPEHGTEKGSNQERHSTFLDLAVTLLESLQVVDGNFVALAIVDDIETSLELKVEGGDFGAVGEDEVVRVARDHFDGDDGHVVGEDEGVEERVVLAAGLEGGREAHCCEDEEEESVELGEMHLEDWKC